ncbi:MAG TPA: SPOR domain-containing protein [Allosphingosinicella sp.]
MKSNARGWMLAGLVCLAATSAEAQPGSDLAAPNGVLAGVQAWQAGNYDVAVRVWRPLADRGNADAQYNLAQAYFLGRGVPQNMNLAEQWYERAARQGHPDAQANYGLLLFQNGRRTQAMPWIQRAAERGDPRAQYVYGTALYNGDIIARDLPRAYAMMTRAAAQNLPPAITQLAELDRILSPQDRARGVEMAQSLASAPVPVLIASAPPPGARPRGAPGAGMQANTPPNPQSRTPSQTAFRTAVAPPRPVPPAPRPAPPAARPGAPAPRAVAVSAGGRWRVQVGAFSSEANARRAWGAASSRLRGLTPFYVHAGAVYRLQAGPLASRAAAESACAASGTNCFPVAP